MLFVGISGFICLLFWYVVVVAFVVGMLLSLCFGCSLLLGVGFLVFVAHVCCCFFGWCISLLVVVAPRCRCLSLLLSLALNVRCLWLLEVLFVVVGVMCFCLFVVDVVCFLL